MVFKRSILGVAIAAATLTSLNTYAESVNQQKYIQGLFKDAKHKQPETLSDAALKAKKLVGAAVSEGVLAAGEEAYLNILSEEFDYVTPENSGKWGPLQSAPGEWDFTTHDTVVDYANLNGKLFKGHTLVWHSQAPSFINSDLTASELQGYIDDHVTTTVSRYTEQFFGWDVVNEAIADDGTYRDSVFFQKLGTDYIGDAFVLANSLDKKARLYYNDYNIAGINAKSDAVYTLMQDLRSNGIPVDGVGFQMHLDASSAPSYDTLTSNFQRFVDLGLKVAITELDVRVANLPWDKATNLAIQQQVYHNAVAACMAFKQCETVTTWGITDKYSWIDSTFAPDDPLPFDESYQAKPAYFGMVDGFMSIAPDAPGSMPNLISNGQFETGSQGWTSWGSAIVERVAAKDFYPESEGYVCEEHLKLDNGGESALLVSERGDTWHAAVYDITNLIQAGTSYNGSVMTKLVGAESDSVTLSAQVLCEGADPTYFNLGSSSVTNQDWSEVAGQFTTPVCDFTAASLYVQGPAADVSFLLDKVALRPEILTPDTTGLGPNVLLNSDFEAGGDYWFGFGDATVTPSTDVANSGSQSGLVSNRTATWQGPATSLLELTEAGENYRLFAWVRSAEEDITVNATLAAGCVDGTQYNYITSVSATANNWSILSGEFTVPSCELNSLVLYMEGPAEGVEFYIDDVNVRHIIPEDTGNNLISNGSFENGISGWSAWGGTLSSTTEFASSGNQSVVLTERTANWQGPVYNLLSTVIAGEEYFISAWGRVGNVASDTMNITVKTACDDGSEQYHQVDSITATDSEWSSLSGSITLPSCNLTEVVMYFDGPAAEADVYLDDVVVSGASGVDPNNLVSNPGFESGLAGWTSWAGTLVSSTDAYSGSASAQLTGRTDTWQGPVYNLLSSVTPATTYSFSAWGKVIGSESEAMNIIVKTTCDDGTEAYNWAGGGTVNDTDWTEIAGSLTLPDCSLTEATMYFDGPVAGIDMLLDDVTVSPSAE